ncbi:hypothetical protein ScPMuIL_006470 [Solemya velum]
MTKWNVEEGTSASANIAWTVLSNCSIPRILKSIAGRMPFQLEMLPQERRLSKLIENAIPTRDVAPREETKQIDWLKFGFLKYPWRCNAGIKLDTTLVNAKLTALECEIDNFRQLQERNEILYGVLQNLKSKAWGAYLQIRENEKTPKLQKAV